MKHKGAVGTVLVLLGLAVPTMAMERVADTKLVAVREIEEGLGHQVVWDGAQSLVTVKDGDNTLYTLTIGDTCIKTSEKEYTLQQPAQIREGRTFVEEAFFEALYGEPDYFGEWCISGVLGYSKVSAMSKEDADALVGKKVVIEAEKVSDISDTQIVEGVYITNPDYTYTVLTESAFASDYQITLEKLGVQGDTIKRIQATKEQTPLLTAFVKDSHTLILYCGGVFFELEK